MKRLFLWGVAAAVLLVACESTAPHVVPDAAITYNTGLPEETDPFLDTLQARTFDWFWETTDAEKGLTPDRYPRRTFASIAAVGFGLTAYGVGAERGYVTREEAAERTLNTLRFFWNAPQGPEQVGMTGFKGFFYHFLEYDTGTRFRNTELSTIDTALLMGGVLFAREYFDGAAPQEAAIRAYADSLFQRVEWDWFRARPPRPTMGWHPESGFGRADWNGYNEAMLLYIMALGTPTFPLDDGAWDAWTSTYEWNEFYGYEHVDFSPLFGHQYSHVWVDFRSIQDAYMREKGIDYFENSRRATLSQRAYAIDNPDGWVDYGEWFWGLTACDGPVGRELEYNGETQRFMTYSARGASTHHIVDDGTIAPTAVGGSIPFAPEVTIPTLKAMRDRYGEALFTEYGFLDAINPSFTFEDVELQHGQLVDGVGWVDGDYLGIDQGPILLMAENYRSNLVWETMRRSPYIVRGLKRAGFTGGWLDTLDTPEITPLFAERQTDPDAAYEDARLVVVIGSSTAEGVGPEQISNAWVNRYRAYLKTVDPRYDVLNLARGGYTTYQLLPTGADVPEGRPAVDTTRNISRALTWQPEAIIVNLPSNDRAAGFTNDEQLNNFQAMVDAAAARDVPIWITTTQPRDLDEAGISDQRAVRDALYERYEDQVIDFWTEIALEDGRLDPQWDSGDRLHLNDAGHAVLFEQVKAADIEKVLAEAGS